MRDGSPRELAAIRPGSEQRACERRAVFMTAARPHTYGGSLSGPSGRTKLHAAGVRRGVSSAGRHDHSLASVTVDHREVFDRHEQSSSATSVARGSRRRLRRGAGAINRVAERRGRDDAEATDAGNGCEHPVQCYCSADACASTSRTPQCRRPGRRHNSDCCPTILRAELAWDRSTRGNWECHCERTGDGRLSTGNARRAECRAKRVGRAQPVPCEGARDRTVTVADRTYHETGASWL